MIDRQIFYPKDSGRENYILWSFNMNFYNYGKQDEGHWVEKVTSIYSQFCSVRFFIWIDRIKFCHICPYTFSFYGVISYGEI